jgi:hypothetical protein
LLPYAATYPKILQSQMSKSCEQSRKSKLMKIINT